MRPTVSPRDLLLLVILLLGAGTLLAVSRGRAGVQPPVQSLGRPLLALPRLGLDLLAGGWDAVAGILRHHAERDRLHADLDASRRENAQLRQQAAEADRLRAELALTHRLPRPGLVARVIGAEAAGWPGELFLDRGADAGCFRYQSVAALAPDGRLVYVGRLAEVTGNLARLRPVICGGMRVPALLKNSNRRGVILAGEGGRDCHLLYVPHEIAVAPGEEVLTSGEVDFIPPGLLLGTVREALDVSSSPFRAVTVTPALDPYTLDAVVVLTAGAAP